MRTYDFSPLFRSTVGFDRLFDMLDNGTRPDWPPYNIQKVKEDQYQISMALAGFGPSEIELIQEGNTLTVTGIGDAKAREIYKGHKPSTDTAKVQRLRDEEKLGPAASARRVGIGRASVYRLLGKMLGKTCS
jgi:HSP20 family molecular chaperone IbpA